MIERARMTARMESDFVLFLIGMRINRLLRPDKWFPVFLDMPAMLRELYRHPERGLMHHELWLGRTVLVLQYWRSLEHLLAYAKAGDARHLPAWRRFNQRIGTDGTVGIWHETYQVRAGGCESLYVNMPAFGLGRAGVRVPAEGPLRSARGRLSG